MNTDDLIAALTADAGPAARPVPSALGIALGLGGLVTLALFAATMGVRADIGSALATWRFDLKVALAGLAVLTAAADCLALSRPTAAGRAPQRTLYVLPLLALAVAIELAMTPAEQWLPRLVGTNALLCLVSIPLLAAAPFAAVLYAMRTAAPASPANAGRAVGVLAAACAALAYATHCFDDSPLFVAVWYSLPVLAMGIVGAGLGRVVLRW